MSTAENGTALSPKPPQKAGSFQITTLLLVATDIFDSNLAISRNTAQEASSYDSSCLGQNMARKIEGECFFVILMFVYLDKF